MPKAKLSTQGDQRRDCPPVRKLPVSRDDISLIRKSLIANDIDSNIVSGVASLGWFFMIRRREYPGLGLEWRSRQKHLETRPEQSI